MARTMFVTRATRRCSSTPAETVSTVSVRPAARRSGRMRPSAPAPLGAADDGAEVLGVLDLVENDDERFGRAGQDVVDRGIALGGNFGHDALMAGRYLVEPAGRDEDAGDMAGFGFADDLSDPGVALLLLDEDLVSLRTPDLRASRRGLIRMILSMAGSSASYKARGGRAQKEFLGHDTKSGDFAHVPQIPGRALPTTSAFRLFRSAASGKIHPRETDGGWPCRMASRPQGSVSSSPRGLEIATAALILFIFLSGAVLIGWRERSAPGSSGAPSSGPSGSHSSCFSPPSGFFGLFTAAGIAKGRPWSRVAGLVLAVLLLGRFFP